MLKLNRRVLEVLEDGKAYFGGGLFTGVAYAENGGRITEVREFREGDEIGDWQNPLIPVSASTPRLTWEIAGLDGDHDAGMPVTLDGKLYNGVVHELGKAYCERESLFEDGEPAVELTWHNSGARAVYERYTEKGLAQVYWGEDGGMTGLRLTRSGGFELRAGFTPEGLLEELVFPSGDYFAEPNEALADLPFPHVGRAEDLADVHAAPSLKLEGEGVSPEAFGFLAQNDGLTFLKRLRVVNTRLDAASIPTIGRAPLLEELEIEGDESLMPALIALKEARPELLVRLNRFPVEAPLEADPSA